MTTDVGAAPAAVVSADSTPAPTEAQKSIATRMAERLQSSRTATTEAANPSPSNARAEAPAAPDADSADQRPTQDGKGDEPREPESIPMAAFKERLGRATEKTKAAEERRNQLALENRQMAEASQLLVAEVNRLRQLLKAGETPDERDEQLHALKLQQQYRDKDAAIIKEHQEELAKAIEEQETISYRDILANDVQEALKGFELVSRPELVAAMKSAQSTDAFAIARDIQEKRLAAAARLQRPRPEAPATVAPAAVATSHRGPLTQEMMIARLQASRVR